MKPWWKSNKDKIYKAANLGLSLGFTLGMTIAFCVIITQSCATVRKFDPATATISDETKTVAPWAVDEHYDEMLDALKKGKKLKVVYIKKDNPIAAWTLGAGMVIGGALIIIGIAIIAFSQGARLWRGLMFVGTGISSFVTFYMIDKYLVWICIGFAAALVAGALYFYFFVKDTADKAIETNDMQKSGEWDEDFADQARQLQGNLQDVISRRAKKVRQQGAKKKAKIEKKINKLAG
jgi:hypothetical protein